MKLKIMSNIKTKKFFFAYAIIFIFILFLFCYFRLKPLYYQTVGYTYDQGRDFLKAAQMVSEKKLTFIGPTTGIQGLFHGAWWYYLLVIPYLLFNGLPIGFYYFNFFIQLVSYLIFSYFLLKNFKAITALILLAIFALSPYFIFSSTFVGNNIMVLPVFMLFLITNYYLLKPNTNKNVNQLIFVAGLLLGFVSEFEVAFGMFLIPIYIILIFLISDLRVVYKKINNTIYFIIGLLIPFIPRILFELKNNFLQTKALWTSLIHGNSQNPNSFGGAFQDRISLFAGYFRSLFASDFVLLLMILLLIFLINQLFLNRVKTINNTLAFFATLLSLLFFFSVLNKDSFFWGNYYEGIQYLYLIILGIFLSMEIKNQTLLNAAKIFILITIVVIGAKGFIRDFPQKPKGSGNLRSQMEIVNYIQAKSTGEKNYCVKIYTPPVIPFTYNYLFLYNKLSKKIPEPASNWVNDKCWYIIENDDNKERRIKWITDNVPLNLDVLDKVEKNDTIVTLYEKAPK